MRTIHTKTLLTALTASAIMTGAATAGTVTSTTFDVDPSSTSIDTTTGGYLDWGYFLPNADFLAGTDADVQSADFDDLKADYNTTTDTFAIDPATNSKAVSGIGSVVVTETSSAEYTNGDTGKAWEFTVNDGIAPVSGTQNPLGAANGISGSEDIFNITFNDLTTGVTTVTLYMDHTNNGRKFDATVDLFASDGDDLANTVQSASIGGTDSEGYFTFTVVVSNDVAGADLSISIDSASGSSGQFQFAGYTVEGVIPEPGSMALLGLGGLLVASRRRRA